jgi:hypothetical protein
MHPTNCRDVCLRKQVRTLNELLPKRLHIKM